MGSSDGGGAKESLAEFVHARVLVVWVQNKEIANEKNKRPRIEIPTVC